jgi:hypothetical protein
LALTIIALDLIPASEDAYRRLNVEESMTEADKMRILNNLHAQAGRNMNSPAWKNIYNEGQIAEAVRNWNGFTAGRDKLMIKGPITIAQIITLSVSS